MSMRRRTAKKLLVVRLAESGKIPRRSPERSQINAIHESGTAADNDHQLTRTPMDRNSSNRKSSTIHNRRLVTFLKLQTNLIAKFS